MDYIFLLIAVLLLGAQFTVSKLYQTKAGSGFFAATLFPLTGAIIPTIVFACLCKFNIPFNWFSFLMAAGATLSIVIYTIIGMKIMSISSVAFYTMFLMAGGMFVPFLYGIIFLNEQLSAFKIIGVILLLIALVFPVLNKGQEKNKNIKLFIILSICIFVLNGLVGVFNKTHQISPFAISTYEFLFWQKLIASIALFIVASIYAFSKKDKTKIKFDIKNALILLPLVVIFVIFSQTSLVLQLISAKTIDAAVMFPIITGGTMVMTSLFGMIFFKEKLDKKGLLALITALVASVLFIF